MSRKGSDINGRSPAVTAAPGSEDNGGAVAQHETTRALDTSVREAMETAWSEICSDTGQHPLDFEWRRGKLFFEPRHWTDLVARLLARGGWRKDGSK